MYERDTIAAIATPLGQGGIAIIRVSGRDAEAVARAIFIPARAQAQLCSHHLYFGRICDPLTGHTLDQGLLVLMQAPRSYTGEDVVEIHCHGGSLLSRRILEIVLRQGARLAEPGEFTKRAFLNGRLDLPQAEAVLDLIQAKSEQGLHLAWEQLSGHSSETYTALRERLVNVLAYIEAFIDFPEDDIPERTQAELMDELSNLIADIAALQATFAQGKVYRDGIRTAIVGKPNVGKSSLLNLLAGAERAIVTAVPGTTRDVLEETVVVGGIPLVVWDTAGLRATTDAVERIGVERARAGVRQAELVIALFDGSRPVDQEDEAVCEVVKGKPLVPVLNKADLPLAVNPLDLEVRLGVGPPVLFSACCGTGFEVLTARIQDIIFGKGRYDFPEDRSSFGRMQPEQPHHPSIIVTQVRHRDALIKSEQYLKNAQRGLEGGLPPDLVAVDLRAALDQIGEITGHMTNEDILDRIFRDFCIGK